MDSSQIVLIAVLAVVLVAAVVILSTQRRRRTRALVEKFGPEYDRTVAAVGRKAKAEKDLEARARRVSQLTIRPLTPAERHRFAEFWRVAQERFVDSPSRAVAEADDLLKDVMVTRGYPIGDFETRAADISVDHPRMVQNYHAAHALAQRSRDGQATTENLRQAMVHYRALFEELLVIPESESEPEPELVQH
jgi:hypothetical protein